MNAIEVRNLTKSFGSCVSYSDLTFTVKKGEVHALLGENGAGKSTLMRTLFGMYRPDAGGEIKIFGETVNFSSSRDAINHGIGMVHQHFMLIRPFTILENVILGIEPRTIIGTIDFKKARREVEKVNQMYNFNLDLDQKIEDLTVGMQQRVEILKTLCREAEIIILDEPTAVLTPQEVEEFLKIVTNLKQLGKTIFLITHKMHEIKAVADRCTIIRKGKFVETVEVATTSEAELAAKMVGRQVHLGSFKNQLMDEQNRTVALSIESVNAANSKGLPALQNFSLTLRRGEITGLAGIDGNGQSELAEILAGVKKATSGKIIIDNKNIINSSPAIVRENKLSVIPADRQASGLVIDYKVSENFVLPDISKKPFSHFGIINNTAIDQHAQSLINRFDIRSPSLHSPARSLSGGNQQKIILAREIAHNPDVLVAYQPTRGLDVGAIEFIHNELLKLRDSGKAILLISYELDEILNLSDRIAIIFEGSVNQEIDPATIASTKKQELKAQIGLAMARTGRHT